MYTYIRENFQNTDNYYRVEGHFANIHSIGTGNVVTKALNRVYVNEAR